MIRRILLTLCFSLICIYLYTLFDANQFSAQFDVLHILYHKSNVSAVSTVSPKTHLDATHHHGRHLLGHEDVVEEIPKPELIYTIDGEDFPNDIDGGSVLKYNIHLTHSVEREHTQCVVVFKVDIPFSTFSNDTLKVNFSSDLMKDSPDDNITMIPLNGTVEHLTSLDQVRFTFNISQLMWINLTEPWKRPDCWWTPSKECYQTDYLDCIFFDASPQQNWDPAYCYRIDIYDCLPANASSECFFLDTMQCIERLNSTTEDISTLLCPKVKETNCIQINDRGLYFTDYNWTQPTLPPPKIPDNIVVEMCDMTSSEIWRETRKVNGTWFETSLFITPTDENGCRLIEMSPMEEPTGPPPTIDPYMGLPTTDEYKIAKECLNINTTGFYHPYVPTIWKKFDIALSFSGMIINTVEVNQKFNAEVNADITQITKKPADQLTQASASVEYKVKKPGTTVTATQTFSENKNALKHEQIDYKVVLKVSECQNGGISLTITCKEINEEQKMNITTPEDDIVVVIGKNLIATTKINETYPGPVPLINLTTVISEKEPPRFELRKVQTKMDQLEPIFDEIVVEFSPFINLYDDKNNLYDRVRIEFSLRTFTNVEPDDVLDVSAKAEYLESPEGGFTGSHSSKLTVTEQPTVPDIPPAKSYIDLDALDDIVYNFTLRHTLEHTLYDIWMEVTCPDLLTLNGTRNLEFIYIGIQPNTTEEVEHTSAWDEKFTLGPKYFIHLVELTPEVVFKGQQTFHIWDNSMKPHQQFWCYIELSYRKEWDKPIVLPYIAGYSPSLTFPQPTYELYGRDIQVNMTQYTMPVGSNATYIMNITFPELTTQMTVSINLPPAVLMLWYALISHHGTNLQLNNSTNTYLGTTEEDIGKWNTSIRTNMLMNFGTVINHADNVATFDGDNLMVEFNVVLLDTPETVVKDAEFSLSTTVSYTNGEDMVQQQTIKVLEPGVTMKLYITNSSTTGDPGDVFQYKVTLTHTEESQSPAHHVLIDIHLQYMEVYADFLPNNQSRAPETQVFHEVGPLKADEIFQLYLYKLELGEIIEGTFLAQVSTKLTTGIALLATAEVDIYSFYQWGRLYEISLASLNVVNIRNATLEFIGTSEPATLDRNVLVHEQATFKYRIPLPPIPTELIVSVRLPQFETTRKKWLLDYLRSSVPDPLPTESVFIEQGCLGTENLLTEDCHCYHSNNLNLTLNLTQIMTAYTCEELQTTAGCSISMAMTWPPTATVSPLSGYSNAGNDTVSGGAENRTSNFSSDNPPTSPTNINTTNQSVGKKTSEDCPFWYYICYKTTIASCEATQLASNLTSLSARNDSTCTNSNDTSVNQTQTGNCTETNEVSCQMVALQVCNTMLYRKCSRHNETRIYSAICLCPMKATTESPNVVTEVSLDMQRILDTYNLCVNRTDTTTETATTAGSSGIAGTDAATGGNGTAAPAMQMTGGPVDDGVDECDFEENVMFGMAAVVHTSMTSTRPGVVCSFKGGNLHDPISPGVIYHSSIVPTKRFRAGDEVSVIVTMLILDEPEVVRGSFLEANFTSTFIYETIPVPPPPMFQENCTCHENEFSTTDLSLSDCRCPSIKLYNATEMDCNCTEIIEAHMIIIQGFGCDCINLCHQRHDYFNAFGKEEQISNLTSLCDCASLNTALNSAGNRQLREHVQECLLVHFNWYTCYSLPYIKDIDVEVCVDVNELSCQAIPVISCTCQQATEPNQYECACRNTSSSSENSDSVIQWNATTGLGHGILHQSSCLCENSEGWPRQCNCTTDNTAIMDGQRCVNEIKPNCSMVKKAVEGVDAETNCSCSRLNRDVAYNATVLLNNTDETNSSSATPSGEMSQEVTVTKYRKLYYLNCSCPDVGQDFDELEDLRCKSLPKTYQATDCSCFVPLDNVTQSILDNWDYNATVKDIAETSMADHVVVVEPELEISFTRQPEPEVVDRLDEVKFDFNVKHTGNSNGPAYNLTVTLYAVNFTRITGTGALTPQAVVTSELCSEPSHCNVTYNNHLGIFYLNFLPVDPPDSAFSGTFTLIVKNHIDFVANSLITAAAILKYDSCSVDFPGRKYGPISDDDTVKIDAPVLSSSLHKSTAYIYHIEEISGPLPKTFSIGDIMVVQAELFVPEITLHMVNLSIESPLQDYIVNYGDAFLTKKISVRNDTESFFLESAGHEGEVYPPSPYNTAEFRKGGFAIEGGVLVSDANNTVTDNDYVTIRFAFRINDVEYWQDDTEIPFTMTSVYVSDYISELITLTDAELMLTVVEPKLSLRAEVLDHSWQLEQVTATSSYTCEVNTCCQDESCEEARICITATDTMTECGTKECRCYSGYFENERGTCTAVGRIAGDIIQYGLTVTHDPEFTGNAFDVLVRLHSDLESDLLEGAHFFSRKMTDFSIMSLLSFPSLLQTSDNDFEVKIQRFNHPDACERFKIPFRIRPEIETYPAMEFSSKATMSYYSSKVYGMTKHSRYYQIDRDVIFNFTAPVPSARFHMIIPSDSSGDIDFPVYSSSDPTHQVMVNLRNASQVKFELELVIPKIICNVTIVMDLPQGNGFTFKSVELTKLGSKIQFPHSKLSNDSITEDLHGNSYFFAELRGLHSVPELIYYPREFDDYAKQKKFKTMKGEEDPYPTYPSCTSLNSEDYEKYLLQGCFLDTTHYFEVTMVTADHAENYNLTQNMTHGNCVQLCRSDGYFYSGTKNGTDCYCGNRTHLELYHDNATVIYTPANQTVLESYYVTVYEACNITYQDSTNKTMIEICQDTAVYQNCTKKEFENCKNSTFFECFQSMTDSCDDQALSKCGDSGDENCIAMENESCRSSADATCQTQAKAVCSEKVIRECKSVAAETYRIRQLDFCRQTLYENCTQEMYTTCNETFSQICSNMAMQRCESPVTWQCYRDQYKNCTVSSNVNCTNLVLEACNNITYFGCQSETIPAHNSTVQECVTTELSNCSACLNQTTHNCIQNNSSDNCSTHASTVCSKWCQFISCADVMIEIAESYVYNNCSLVELISFNATYLGNCSHEELRWKNVTYVINVPYYIQMSDCNVTCTGDSNTTCGGRDYITIYGPMYSSVVEQTCDWYTGLHQRDEDVLTLEFAFFIDALSTKGVTEILHPYVSYDHGQDRIPTAIPFAPYLLEAGDVILDMTVSVSPSHDGFYPGDILEYYTEVRHNPLSTVTARDVHVVWLFPYYVEFIELYNHKMAASKDACRDTIPVTAQTTTPDESFKFHVSTLHNTDCISFHFSIRIDPNNELTQGYYHLVASSETYYYSWDLHNPYEDDFKHNVLVHYHDIIPTSVKFEVPSKYTGRPELEDLKLSTYNFLYDEQHNIMYACFFNNTMHVYEGGCFMVGVLPVYYTEVPHTCEQYCNCTFQGGIPSNANCTDYDPKPDNCSCGCVPDCYEFFDLCELSCYTNCTNCTLDDIDLCVDGCRRTLTNCSQECCIGDCDVVLDVCLFNCTNCTSQSNCTAELNSTAAVVDHNCTVECFHFHGLCSYHCVKEPNTCYDNCTDMAIACSDLCDNVECNPSIYPDDSEGQQNCTIQCYHQCSTDHVNCSKECCFEECSYNFTQCMDNCLLCGDDLNCSVSCNLTCQHQYGNCSYECDPVPKTCRENCTIDQVMCQEPCLAKCSAETCESLPGPSCASENVTLNSTNCTSSENHQSCANISESCLHEEICSSTTDTVCLKDCEGKCDTTYSDCQDLCCVEDCSVERQACNSNCTDICQGDRLCLWQCRNNCTDLYDVCSHQCTFPDWICKNNCSDEYNLCLWECPDEIVAASQNISNSTVSNSTVSNAALSSTVVSNTSVVSCGLNITQSNTSSNCSTLNCREHCNATYQNCTRDCPCAEPCSLTHKDCWLACNGCENNCERICRGDCETSRGICSSECIAEQSGIPNDCLALCGTNVTAFVISCATNMTNNQTFADCVSQSVQNSTQCSQSCYRYLGIEDCSLCEMQIQNCSSICSKEKCSINDTRCHENCTVNCTSLNSQCFQNCNMVYPSTLAECWNSCNYNITSCLHPCLDCNDTSCNPAECSTTCLESHRLCSRTCHRKFVSPGCDDKCEESKKSCFTQCRRDCSMCRGHCHDACNFKEDLCFMRCLPPVNCTEVHGLCLGNCSECQCAEECQSINCTEMAITCMDDCSPAGVGQCYTNLTQCIHNCSVCTSNNCTNCTTQCGLQYYQCMISELQQKQTPTTETSTVMTVSVLSTTASASNISSVNTTTDIPLTNTTNKQTYTNQTTLNDTVIESGSNASSIDTFIVPSSNTSQNQSRDVSEVNYSRFSNCSSACSHRYTVCISSIHKVGNIPSSANLTLNLTSHRNCSDENCTSSENITSSSGNCTASSNYSCSTMNHTESPISSEDLIDCMQTLINCEVNCFMRTVPVITDCESECQSNQVSCTDRCSVCTKYCQSCQYQCDIDLHNCTVMAELLAGPLTTTLEPPTTPQPVSLEDTCADANTCWNNCYYESYKTCISCSSETEECPTLSECTDLMQDCRVTCTQTYIDPTCEDISCATLCQSKRRKRNIETVYPRIPEYVHEVDSALNTVDMKAVLDESLPSSLIKDLKRLYIALILNKASVPLYNHFKDLEDIKDTSIKYIALGTNLLDGIIDSSSHYIDHIASLAQMLNRDTSFDEAFQQTVDVHDKVTGHHLERRSVSNETVDESAPGNNITHFANHTSNYTKFSNHSVSDDEHVFCISNDKYMTYINCKDNCSVKYERCVAGCLVNKTCDGNLTVNNCSSGSDSICAKNCSSNCTDVCDELRPYSHRLCYHSCENVTNCSENHGNCSRHGDANCSMAFSNVTVKNTTQCLAECDQNAEFENCSSLCDGVPCSDSTSCQCDCECTNTTVAVETTMASVFAANATNTTTARHGNRSVNATSANVTAMGSPYEENCRCICNCVEIEADIGNYSQVFTHWRALDTNVGNLLGLEITDNTLYALSHNGLAVMRSRDYGETWVSIHPDYWSEAKMSETYRDAMSLKDEELRTVPSDQNVFVSDVWNVTWGVSGVGIHFTGENRTKWELLGTWKCCGDTKP